MLNKRISIFVFNNKTCWINGQNMEILFTIENKSKINVENYPKNN